MNPGKTDNNDSSIYGWTPKPVPAVRETMAKEIMERGAGAAAADLRAASPVPIDWPPEEDSWRMLSHLFGPDDNLFLGANAAPGVHGESILAVVEWMEFLKTGGGGCPHSMFAPNPLSDMPGIAMAGRPANRSGICIAVHRYMVCELASVPLERQYAFWRALPHLPVAAIIHNGKDALQALVRVDAADENEWSRGVVKTLVEKFLQPLGINDSCRNASSIARMPGHRRADTGQWQRLLYLAPEGKAVAHAF